MLYRDFPSACRASEPPTRRYIKRYYRDSVCTKYNYQHDTRQQKEVSHLVSAPTEAVELESEHADRRNEEQGGQHGDQQHPVRRESEHSLLPQHAERSAEKRSGGRRKSAEFDRLRFVDVELGQTQRRKRRQDEHAIPELPGLRQPARSVCRQTCQSTAAGASPEVMTSANESSCTPIAEGECNRRATKPSKKSNTIPATISQKRASNHCTSVLPRRQTTRRADS